MTLLISHKRSVNSRVTISCSYLTIVIGKWCSFLEASCLNRRPGRGTSGTASLSSSLASKLERGSSSGAYPPFTTAFNTSRSILASRARETCVVLTTRVRSNKGDALFKYSTKSTISSFVQIRAISVLIRPFFHDRTTELPNDRTTERPHRTSTFDGRDHTPRPTTTHASRLARDRLCSPCPSALPRSRR